MKITQTEEEILKLIWDYEPINSSEFVKICFKKFGWKKSTTYTLLKRLEDKGVIVNNKTIITSLIEKEQMQTEKSENIIDDLFDGSLPLFVATFLKSKKLSEEEYKKIEEIINQNKEK